MQKIDNLVGLSIYPVAWLISIITNLINEGKCVIDYPGSVPFYLFNALFNFVGLRFLCDFNGFFIVLILILISFIIYKKIASIHFMKARFIILLTVYLFLVFLNAYSDINIDM